MNPTVVIQYECAREEIQLDFYSPIKPTLSKEACEIPQEHLTITIHHYWLDNRLYYINNTNIK